MSFSPTIQQGRPVHAYSPQCAVLLYIARDHLLLGMTKSKAVKAVLEALEKQIANDHSSRPDIVKVVPKTPPTRSFPLGSWFVDASVSSVHSQKGTPLGTGVAAYNPATGYFICSSFPLVIDTTDAEALAIKYAAEQNPERVYSDSEACYHIMRSDNKSKRINARLLLEPLRGEFFLEKIDRKQNIVADKLANWARYHKLSVAGYVKVTGKELSFSGLRSLEAIALEKQAKSLTDKARSLEASLAEAREKCSKLNMAMIQQDALDRFNLEGFE